MTNLDAAIMKEMDYETFVKIISDIPSCIFFKDTELKYRFSSHCWAQLISDDIVGKTDLDIRKDKENAEKAMEADRQIIASKKGCSYVIKSDIDGEVSYLELIKEPIIKDDGTVIGIVGLINDVTEQKVMEKRIVGMSEMLKAKCREQQSSLERIQKMNTAQKLFTASMNHELRSPLNGIIGNLQLLLADDTLNEEQKQYVDNAFTSSKMMLDIVNELLDFAKGEMSGLTIRNKEFSLSKILNNLEFTAKVQARNKGLDFFMFKDDNLPERYISDEQRINQILTNIVSNAIKYTETGSIVITVSSSGDKLVFSCSDTGQGIDKASIDSLFDPFTRFNEDNNVHIQGTGLGLAVVKRIIDSMNGEITVDSTVGEGSTFTVMIPVEQVTESDGLVSASAETATVDFGSLTALCVDDSAVNAKIMSSLLGKLGMTADSAFSANEAIQRAEEVRYDIIFMDHMMPDMNGIETFKAIREKGGVNASTPVVMLTGNAGEDYEDYYRQQGAQGYLLKPVLIEQLKEVVVEVVGRKL